MIWRALVPLLICLPAFATPIPSDQVFEKMKNLDQKADRHPLPQGKFEISASLPPESAQGDQEISTHITAYYTKKDPAVRQISLRTQNCKVAKESDLDKTAMQERVAGLVKKISGEILGQPFALDGERYFKELGPVWWKSVEVKIREPHPGVRSMKIARGVSKCDARGGYYFRYDFYL